MPFRSQGRSAGPLGERWFRQPGEKASEIRAIRGFVFQETSLYPAYRRPGHFARSPNGPGPVLRFGRRRSSSGAQQLKCIGLQPRQLPEP